MNKFVIRETKPTITLSSSSPSGVKTPGNQETLRFNVAASSNEDVVLNNIIFTFSASDNALNDWNQCDTDITDGSKLYASGADFHFYNLTEDSSASTALAGTYSLLKSTGAVCDATNADVAFVKLALTTAEVVPAGTTTTYSLWFNSDTASSLNDDSVQIGLATDPITSSYIEVVDSSGDTAIAIGDTTIVVDTDATTIYSVGDVIGYDTTDGNGAAAPDSSERMLVTAVAATQLTVVRGYLGTTPITYAGVGGSDDIYRLPGALLWQDDGSTTVSSSTQEYYGAYLVDNLPVTGNSLSF